MSEPIYLFGPEPSGDEESRYLTADQLGVGHLRHNESIVGEWILTPAGPVTYNPVAFRAADQDEAEEKAKSWIDTRLRTFQADLFHED